MSVTTARAARVAAKTCAHQRFTRRIDTAAAGAGGLASVPHRCVPPPASRAGRILESGKAVRFHLSDADPKAAGGRPLRVVMAARGQGLID